MFTLYLSEQNKNELSQLRKKIKFETGFNIKKIDNLLISKIIKENKDINFSDFENLKDLMGV